MINKKRKKKKGKKGITDWGFEGGGRGGGEKDSLGG